ncbi:hypothetical protein WJX74_000383 [Apatococcus lobatus]|uniref:Uncharacterized protein n=2 Tax=Apatococcus TaxID=904362 RepID=A0AAW1T4S0_9CHLO
MPSNVLALTIQALGFAGVACSITYAACIIEEEIAATGEKAGVRFEKACRELLQDTTADFQLGWLRGKLGPVKFANSEVLRCCKQGSRMRTKLLCHHLVNMLTASKRKGDLNIY